MLVTQFFLSTQFSINVLSYFLFFYLVCVKAKNVTFVPYYSTGGIPPRALDIRRIGGKTKWYNYDDQDVPDFFDSRDEWPHCNKSINNIFMQQNCGFCWALVTASILTDRYCIFNKGKYRFTFSSLDLVSCCNNCIKKSIKGKDRCSKGSNSVEATAYAIEKGVVSSYCKPITRNVTKYGEIPPCENKCTNKNATNSNRERIKAVKYYFKYDDHNKEHRERQIQIEIMENGPVGALIEATEDFKQFFYQQANANEIYQGREGSKQKSNHEVKLLGWGQTNGIPYWICANSWGKEWGNKGVFKILRGNNILQIEDLFVVPYYNDPPGTPLHMSYEDVDSCAITVTVSTSILFCSVTNFL